MAMSSRFPESGFVNNRYDSHSLSHQHVCAAGRITEDDHDTANHLVFSLGPVMGDIFYDGRI